MTPNTVLHLPKNGTLPVSFLRKIIIKAAATQAGSTTDIVLKYGVARWAFQLEARLLRVRGKMHKTGGNMHATAHALLHAIRGIEETRLYNNITNICCPTLNKSIT